MLSFYNCSTVSSIASSASAMYIKQLNCDIYSFTTSTLGTEHSLLWCFLIYLFAKDVMFLISCLVISCLAKQITFNHFLLNGWIFIANWSWLQYYRVSCDEDVIKTECFALTALICETINVLPRMMDIMADKINAEI